MIISQLLRFFSNFSMITSKENLIFSVIRLFLNSIKMVHGISTVFSRILPLLTSSPMSIYLDFKPYSKKFGFCSLSPVRDAKKELRAEKSSLVAKLKKVFALGAVNDVVVDLFSCFLLAAVFQAPPYLRKICLCLCSG